MRGPVPAEKEGRNLRTGLFCPSLGVLFYSLIILLKIKLFNLNYNGWGEAIRQKIAFPES